jgi:hypothetical protein
MDNLPQDNSVKPDLKTGLLGLSMFGVGILGLVPALICLAILGAIGWYGINFFISLFGLLFS